MRHCTVAHRVTTVLCLRAHKMDSPRGGIHDGIPNEKLCFTQNQPRGDDFLRRPHYLPVGTFLLKFSSAICLKSFEETPSL